MAQCHGFLPRAEPPNDPGGPHRSRQRRCVPSLSPLSHSSAHTKLKSLWRAGHGYAVSLDDWHYALTPAYTTLIDVEGGGTVSVKRRERPQLLLRNGTPAVLYNGVMPRAGLPFTWAQAIGGPQ